MDTGWKTYLSVAAQKMNNIIVEYINRMGVVRVFNRDAASAGPELFVRHATGQLQDRGGGATDERSAVSAGGESLLERIIRFLLKISGLTT